MKIIFLISQPKQMLWVLKRTKNWEGIGRENPPILLPRIGTGRAYDLFHFFIIAFSYFHSLWIHVSSRCSSGTAPFALICNKVHDLMRWFKMHKGFAITVTCNQKLKWHISSFKRPVIKMDQVTIMNE